MINNEYRYGNFINILPLELATWLVGPNIVDNEDATRNDNNDCLLNIIIENAQENIEILLPTLQFVEVIMTALCASTNLIH